jgi:opacity protein-like surface antigen
MVLLITTLSLAIAATNPAGESEYNSDLNLNLGGKHYIGAAAAGTEGSWYFKPGIAINNVKDITILDTKIKFDSSTSLKLGFGFHIADNVRLELDYFNAENDIKDSAALLGATVTLEQETFSVMALYDFTSYRVWTPFIGVGATRTDAKLTVLGLDSDTSDDVAICFCAGFDWALSDSVDLYAEYRTSKPTYDLGDALGSIDVTNNTIMIGINWRF